MPKLSSRFVNKISHINNIKNILSSIFFMSSRQRCTRYERIGLYWSAHLNRPFFLPLELSSPHLTNKIIDRRIEKLGLAHPSH
jgi:hypothetical protein